jgi:4-amino-4-deoxy-L-arabinose transferase-like glycosyltransferase
VARSCLASAKDPKWVARECIQGRIVFDFGKWSRTHVGKAYLQNSGTHGDYMALKQKINVGGRGWRARVCRDAGKQVIPNARSWMPFAFLVAIYIGFGIIGHDPWKADEAYIFGIVHSMLEDNSWLVPLLAGEPFLEKPPLYAWLAAGMVKLLNGWLSAPDAARTASAIFMAAATWSLAEASRRWWGRGAGRFAPILLCSCIGVLVQSHMMMPDVALLAGISLALWGFSLVLESPVAGGLLLAFGAGVGFLAKGLLGPGVIGLCAVLLPVFFAQWRARTYGLGLLVAACAASPLFAVWPTLLYVRSPELFTSWLWDNNIGRFLGSSIEIRGTEKPPWFWLQTLPWFAFPALPLAMHTLLIKRHAFLLHPGMQCLSLCAGIILLTLSTSAAARAVYAFPLLAPISVLGVPAIFALSRALERAWITISVTTFGVFSACVWITWLVMMFTGIAPAWPWLNRWLPADFAPQFDLSTLILALALTLGGIAVTYSFVRRPGRGLLGWMSSVTFAWALLTILAMPWLDYAKSYRVVFESIPWPQAHHCIESRGLGESERAMLDYYADRLTLRRELSIPKGCDLLLVQGYAIDQEPMADEMKWKMIWSGARPGDTWQKFWLYKVKEPPVVVTKTNTDEGILDRIHGRIP